MALLYLNEYRDIAQDRSGRVVMVPFDPPAVVQPPIDFSGGADVSDPFGEKTSFILISTDAVCHIIIGDGVSATTINERMGAGEKLFRGVQPGHVISVIGGV